VATILTRAQRFAAIIVLLACGGMLAAQAEEGRIRVVEHEVRDLKAVLAAVRSRDRIEARVRTPGTVVSLEVDEGVEVVAGQRVATVADPKIALRIKALEAQIQGLVSRVANARLDVERAEQLRQRGVTPQARLDQLRSALDVAENELKAARAERQVAEEQVTEGQVLAPAGGRVLRVPVTEGSVVMLGESVATIAASGYLLRLELPERHARFMRKGDVVSLGPRGLAPSGAPVGEGRIAQVYPELESGRVIADAEVPGLGDYFVGERVLVWIAAGSRKAIVVLQEYVATRFGLDTVHLARPAQAATEIVVQAGRTVTVADGGTGREILAGLRAGDEIVQPERKP